jgi:hypothetical protein
MLTFLSKGLFSLKNELDMIIDYFLRRKTLNARDIKNKVIPAKGTITIQFHGTGIAVKAFMPKKPRSRKNSCIIVNSSTIWLRFCSLSFASSPLIFSSSADSDSHEECP